jgi:phosphatidate phosphatase APP1
MITDGETLFMKNIKNKIRKVVGRNSNATENRYNYEEMMLFPNIGFQRKDGNWRLNVHGWRFQTSRRNKFLGQSSSTLGERLARLFASSEQIVYYNDTFRRDRLKPFMVEDKTHEEILIRIGTEHNYTTTTDSEGQFRTSFIIPDVDVQELKKTVKNDQVLTYQAVGDNNDLWEGKIHLLERRGLSVISDIDDTIKISEVLDKIRLVANTFIHGFRVVEGL